MPTKNSLSLKYPQKAESVKIYKNAKFAANV